LTVRLSTVIESAGNCCLAGWLGPAEDAGVEDSEEDDELDAAGEPPDCPVLACPVSAAPGLTRAGPVLTGKYGFALNIVSTIPAIMASTRHPAMTGKIMLLLPSGARQRLLRSCRRSARSSR
jgi:hypothetical protein